MIIFLLKFNYLIMTCQLSFDRLTFQIMTCLLLEAMFAGTKRQLDSLW